MRRLTTSLLAISVALTVSSISWGSAAESRCEGLSILSRNSANVLSFNPGATPCAADFLVEESRALADGPVDFRLIVPNSDLILVRYIDPIPRTPSSVSLVLNGLGFRNKRVSLVRVDVDDTGVNPSYIYESGEIPIDPSAQGCLTADARYTVKKRVKHHGKARVKTITLWRATAAYHTFDTVAC